eukprot:TRINITY_DN2976_c0_g1_i3.p1 TRINITY_DN2976_c0_g1~~TRINITY_DN2976_c0_g1_i3.p1  ORF type:complete len:704 (+),score=159.52 TRINITY_DN2976_c0_g1_i3:359-2470(+)
MDGHYSGDPEEIFELGDKLGEGAYGAVFKASWREPRPDEQQTVAVKILPFLTDESKRAVQKELDVLNKSHHQHLVSYFGSYLKDTYLWLTMEYCDVGSVADTNARLRRHANSLPMSAPLSAIPIGRTPAVTERVIAAILHQTIQGLSFLHSEAVRVIHRDLKGNNLLLTSDGVVKIADFGISFQQSGSRTMAATLIGTPLFMAPEILDGEGYTFSADIWSLGIAAIELADGFPPYFGEHPMRALYLLSASEPPTVKDKTHWSPEFLSFIASCLKKEPAERATTIVLLQHPFLQKAAQDDKVTVKAYVEEALRVRSIYTTATTATTAATVEPTAGKDNAAVSPAARSNQTSWGFPQTLSDTLSEASLLEGLSTIRVRDAGAAARLDSDDDGGSSADSSDDEGSEQPARDAGWVMATKAAAPPSRFITVGPAPPKDKKPKPQFERSSSSAMFDSLSKGAKLMLKDDSIKVLLERVIKDEAETNSEGSDNTSNINNNQSDGESDEKAKVKEQRRPSGTNIFFKEMRDGMMKTPSDTVGALATTTVTRKAHTKKHQQRKGSAEFEKRPKRTRKKKLEQQLDSSSEQQHTVLQRSISDFPLVRSSKTSQPLAETPFESGTPLAEVKQLSNFDQYLSMPLMDLILEIETWKSKCAEKELELQLLRDTASPSAGVAAGDATSTAQPLSTATTPSSTPTVPPGDPTHDSTL